MKKEDLKNAQLVHSALCLPTDCYDQNGTLIQFEYIVAIDDDITSAIYAVKLAKEMARMYRTYPTILCVGGQGILSRHLYSESEARVLYTACLQLGYPKDLVYCEGLDTGHNSIENVENVYKLVNCNYLRRRNVLFCVAKRQSLAYGIVLRKHTTYMNYRLYVIDESVEQACKLMNGKALCGGEMMLHELAGILPRYDEYAKKHPGISLVNVSEEVRAAADNLAKRYRLKLRGKKRLIDYLRYFKLYLCVLFSRTRIVEAMSKELRHNWSPY